LAAGSLAGGLAGATIAAQLGWAYIFWIDLALAAACFVGTIFFVPETLYHGRVYGPISEELMEVNSKEAITQTRAAPTKPDYRPFTFARSLGFRKPAGRVVHHFLQPWHSLALPGTWVVTLQYGGLVGGIVTISTVGPQLLAMPPYLWGNNVGLINVGGLIGTVLGAIYTYFVADARVKSAAKHHTARIVEPESRLPTMFPALFIATAGFLVFGFCAQNPGPNVWVGLEVGYGMITFGLMQAPSIGFNYVSTPVIYTCLRRRNQCD
jgi:MFS family permease